MLRAAQARGGSSQVADTYDARGMETFLVWHVHHAERRAGIPHWEVNGVLEWDEEKGDDLKILGVFSSELAAEARIERARQAAGFSKRAPLLNDFVLRPRRGSVGGKGSSQSPADRRLLARNFRFCRGSCTRYALQRIGESPPQARST